MQNPHKDQLIEIKLSPYRQSRTFQNSMPKGNCHQEGNSLTVLKTQINRRNCKSDGLPSGTQYRQQVAFFRQRSTFHDDSSPKNRSLRVSRMARISDAVDLNYLKTFSHTQNNKRPPASTEEKAKLDFHGPVGRAFIILGDADVFKHSKTVEQHEILKYETEFLHFLQKRSVFQKALKRSVLREVHLTAVMGDETRYTVEQCGLAAPEGPNTATNSLYLF